MKKSYQTHRSLRALAGWSLASLLTANSAFAATSASWTNSLSGYWGATTNWNPNTPPANAGDTASLNGSTDNLTVTNASAAGTAATNTVGTLNADLHYTLRPASSGNSLLVLDNGASSNPAFTISHSGGGYFTVYTPIQIASTNTRTLQVSGSLSMSAKIYSVISGPGGVYFEGQTSGNSSQGEPSIYLYNQSTYGGATEIGQANQAAGNIADGATVICNTNNSLPPTTVLTIDGNTKFTSLGFTMASGQYLGGTLNLNGYTNVLAGLSGGTSTGVAYSGTYSGNTYNEGRVENTASAPSLLDVSNTVSCVFNGKILQTSGTISLTKHGPASF